MLVFPFIVKGTSLGEKNLQVEREKISGGDRGLETYPNVTPNKY